MSALFLDLDRLKAINDYLGHHAGDWFIQAFAAQLREETAEGDVIARLGATSSSSYRPDRWTPTPPLRWRIGCRRCCATG